MELTCRRIYVATLLTLSPQSMYIYTGINVTDVPDAGYGTWDAFASKEGMAGLLASHKEAMVRVVCFLGFLACYCCFFPCGAGWMDH